jgi:putative endonuclease
MPYHVYIVTNRSGTLYTCVTAGLEHRVWEHKTATVEGFTKRYRITRLVYFEEYADVQQAIAREKQIKAWTRKKRIDLINSMNPKWLDLSEGWYEVEASDEDGVPLQDGEPSALDGRNVVGEGLDSSLVRNDSAGRPK